MKSVAEGRVAKKFALYPPKRMLERLGMREGNKVRYEIQGGKLVVEPVQDPLDLALHSKKWTKTTTQEIEQESEKEQSELYA